MTTRSAAAAWESLFRVQVTLMRRFEAARDFAPLTSREYDVLFNLSRAPGGAARLRDLNEKSLLAQPSLSRMVDRLAAEGLVERREAHDDGRGVVVALTGDGGALQRSIGLRHVRSISASIDHVLDADEQATLAALCDRLRVAAPATGPGPAGRPATSPLNAKDRPSPRP